MSMELQKEERKKSFLFFLFTDFTISGPFRILSDEMLRIGQSDRPESAAQTQRQPFDFMLIRAYNDDHAAKRGRQRENSIRRVNCFLTTHEEWWRIVHGECNLRFYHIFTRDKTCFGQYRGVI